MDKKKKFIAGSFVFLSIIIILLAGGCHQTQDPDVVDGAISNFSFHS